MGRNELTLAGVISIGWMLLYVVACVIVPMIIAVIIVIGLALLGAISNLNFARR
jgi:hypothetical protein